MKKGFILLLFTGAQMAYGNLVLSSANFVSGTGLGSEPTLLTIQQSGNNNTEAGCVGSTSGQTGTAFTTAGVCTGSSGDVKTGAGQIGPQTFSTAGIMSASSFGIVFNAAQPAGGPITLTGLQAAFYSPTGAFLYETGSFSCGTLAPGCVFPSTNTGVGKSGFLFVLDSTQQMAAAAAGVNFSTGGTIVGLSASASGASGGPETFYLANVPGNGGGGGGGGQTPEPATVMLSLSGLALVLIGPIRKKLGV